LFHGLFLVLERTINISFPNKQLQRLAAHSYVWLVLLFSWVFFRAADLNSALQYLQTMLFLKQSPTISPDLSSFLSPYLIGTLVLGCIISVGFFSTYFKKLLIQRVLTVGQFRWMETIFLLLVFCLSVLQIMTGAFNPFIYYRF
jgi:alginate O-acetyltransferase complex protein AlgI